MAVIQSTVSSESPGRIYTSRYLDNAGAVAANHTPGFQPRMVKVHNVTDSIMYEWHEGMAAGTYEQTIANGTRSLVVGGTALVVTQGGNGVQPNINHAVVTNKQYSVLAFA